ncbi:MAG: zinc metallopeptidase [Synergistaceae bacterium]|jgi:Zn-dependent membrane protease YugP|nr:zinc metallopeptidase [Synergistaceae bacterium]
MFPMMFDPTYFIFLMPAMLLAIFAQMRVKTAFARYSSVYASKGVRAEDVCRMLLDNFRLYNVRIERVPGNLTDHYDPRTKTLRLSDSVGGSSSIAAIGVAAHEVGHAVQDKEGYAPLHLRNKLVPVANIGSTGAFPLFFLGLFLRIDPLVNVGILLFSCAVIFHLVTLPVEFDASGRALKLLSSTGALTSDEISGAKSVLNAAALTYVAATIMAVLQLLYLLARANGRRN